MWRCCRHAATHRGPQPLSHSPRVLLARSGACPDARRGRHAPPVGAPGCRAQQPQPRAGASQRFPHPWARMARAPQPICRTPARRPPSRCPPGFAWARHLSLGRAPSCPRPSSRTASGWRASGNIRSGAQLPRGTASVPLMPRGLMAPLPRKAARPPARPQAPPADPCVATCDRPPLLAAPPAAHRCTLLRGQPASARGPHRASPALQNGHSTVLPAPPGSGPL